MNRSSGNPCLVNVLLAALLSAAVLQTLNAYLWSIGGGLAHSWIGTVLLAAGSAAAFGVFWKKADVSEKERFLSAWTWPLPWVFLAILTWQSVVYPPVMSDSLCYRLPRIFLWLQEGSITRSGASDGRIQEMPWAWEILALPLVAVNRLTLASLVNLAAWVAALQLIHHWALRAGADRWRARWLSLAVSTAPVFLLQAVSTANDLFAAVLLMISLHFILSFGAAPHWSKVFLSLLALMMACGIKPQFLVLGAGWGFWWIFDPSKPWKHTPLAGLAVAGPLALLVSPLPVFVLNHLASGKFMGAGMAPGVESGSALLKAVAATLQFFAAQLQVPVMPGAERITAALQSPGFVRAIHAEIPQFGPEVLMIPIIDKAGFGLIHFGLLAAGVALGLRLRDRRLWWVAGFVAGSFLLAGSQVVPETIGRSFLGFGALLVPLAVAGLAPVRRGWLVAWCVAGISGGFVAMILNPSCPAWPSRMVERMAGEAGKTGAAEKLERYHAYQERAATGKGFLDPVPPGEPVAVLVRGFTPLTGLWTPDWRRHRIDFVHEIPAGEFAAGEHDWLLIGDNAVETFPGQVEEYRGLDGWEIVREDAYLTTLSQGPERWVLYRRTSPH